MESFLIFMKKTILIGGVIIAALVLVFFLLRTPQTPLETTPPTETTPLENPSSQEVREINITAKQWSFEPETIRVKKGEMVRLNIKSLDVTHGFALPALGISEVLEPGKTTTVEFQATREGTYSFFCNVFCGAGHSSMRGTLIVE